MFTIPQIKSAHAKVKSGADFPQYISDIKALGVAAYDTYVSDGHAEYHSAENGTTLSSDPTRAPLSIAQQGSATALKQALAIHQAGNSDYPTFCQQAADAGVSKWTVDTKQMTCTYHDQQGNALVIESIPTV